MDINKLIEKYIERNKDWSYKDDEKTLEREQKKKPEYVLERMRVEKAIDKEADMYAHAATKQYTDPKAKQQMNESVKKLDELLDKLNAYDAYIEYIDKKTSEAEKYYKEREEVHNNRMKAIEDDIANMKKVFELGDEDFIVKPAEKEIKKAQKKYDKLEKNMSKLAEKRNARVKAETDADALIEKQKAWGTRYNNKYKGEPSND